MTTIFFTADTHFGHAAILRHMQRPWPTIEAMDEALIANWNAVVGPRDEVWHLGDVTFRHPRDYLPRLHGRLHIVLGNHDHPARFAGLVASVQQVKYLRLHNRRLFLSHYAHRVWPGSHRGVLHLYGHSHGQLASWNRSTDVGVDAHAFAPVALEQLTAMLGAQPLTYHHLRPLAADTAPVPSTIEE